jgi:hypothetical protein
MKTCSKCRESKHVDEFSKNKSSADGRNAYCKPCMAAYYQVNRERIKSRQKEYNAANAEKLATAKRNWRLNNAEKHKEARDRYYEQNKAEIVSKVAEWRKANPEARKAEYRKSAEKIKQRAKAWQLANPAKRRLHWANYRANKLRATPGWVNKEAVRVLYGTMSNLNRDGRWGKFHVDHIVPLRHPLVCGLHTHTNLRVISAKANMDKSNRTWPDMP